MGDLTNANLTDAWLESTNLSNADLTNITGNKIWNASVGKTEVLKTTDSELQNTLTKGPVIYPSYPTLEEENEKYLTILFHHPDTSKIRKKGVLDMLDKKKAFEY